MPSRFCCAPLRFADSDSNVLLCSIDIFRLQRAKPVNGHEIDAIRTLLTSKPRPSGWNERRQRIDEIGSTWPVADDVRLEPVDLGGGPGEWSIVPGSDASHVLVFFHGGGFCSGSVISPRRVVTEAGPARRTRSLPGGDRLAARTPLLPAA